MKFKLFLICVLCGILSSTAQQVTLESDTVAAAALIQRLQSPDAAISVDAPDALIGRTVVAVEETESSETEDTYETEESADAEKTHSARSGKAIGYRVQVYADNNSRSAKSEARQRERAISQSMPEYSTYVTYNPPYWRLRVGDFRSQYDAEKAASEIKRQFPRYAREVRIVRDRINVH
jgi:hypothetical protein